MELGVVVKWVIGVGAAALVTGFVAGRSTVPNTVIGVDPKDFEAQASELEEMARRNQELETQIDLFYEEICGRGSAFGGDEFLLELNGQHMRVRCPSRDAGDGIGQILAPDPPPLVELVEPPKRGHR